MKFRNRLLLFGFAVAGLAAFAVIVSAETLIRRSVADRVTERLRAEALVLASLLADDPRARPGGERAAPTDEADRFADTAGRDLGFRVTLVSSDGVVLGDSSIDAKDLAGIENHAGRPEIESARRQGAAIGSRRSATVHDDLQYLAQRVDRSGRVVGFVRLAIPVREIQRTTGNYSLKLAFASFLALLGVAIVGYLAARRFSRPIEAMSRAADEIAAGRREAAIEYESGDEIGHLGAALNRMTRTLSAQIASLTAEKRLRDTMLEGMSEGLLVVDARRHVVLCSNALRALLGLRAVDPVGRPLIEVVRNHAVLEAFDDVLTRGGRRRDVVRPDSGGGSVVELTVMPLADPEGAPLGAVGLLLDITRLTALEGVRRDFVADVSHELRTPLTTIRSFVETLESGGIDDAGNSRRFLEIIRKHCDRMEAILDDLTDLSLIETGAVILEPAPIELAPFLRDLAESERPRADALGIALVSEVPAGVRLTADRRRLEQIMLNLLENAIKFNKPGGSVTVRAARTDDGVRIEVADTGVGIPADALERIFNRFYRVDRSRSRHLGGTGLGLSIVKHLMRLHGGTVRAESNLGEGSRFILEFPPDSAGGKG